MVRLCRPLLSQVGAAALALLLGGILAVGVAAPARAALPDLRDGYGPAIEAAPPYQPQTTCLTSVQPGTRDLAALLERSFPGTDPSLYVRACSQGATSEHKEGRAIDWMVDASVPAEAAAAEAFIRWVTATDRYGNPQAMARRLGIMYIIWKGRLWRGYAGGGGAWVSSTGHFDHVHISLGWNGARRLTSYWTRSVSGSVLAPPPPGSGSPAVDVEVQDVVWRPSSGVSGATRTSTTRATTKSAPKTATGTSTTKAKANSKSKTKTKSKARSKSKTTTTQRSRSREHVRDDDRSSSRDRSDERSRERLESRSRDRSDSRSRDRSDERSDNRSQSRDRDRERGGDRDQGDRERDRDRD